MCLWKLCCVTFQIHTALIVDFVFATWCIVLISRKKMMHCSLVDWYQCLQQCALVSWQDRLGMYWCSEENAASFIMVGDGGNRFLLNTSTYLDYSTLRTEKTSSSEMAHTYQSTQRHHCENHQSHSVPFRFSKYFNSHVGLVYCLAQFYIFF